MDNVSPTAEENAILSSLNPMYADYSEMSFSERRFLNALLLRRKPLKALEVGVSAGSSSVAILNALKATPGSCLHAIDYSSAYYRDASKKSGFLVSEYPDLTDIYRLYTGGLACRFMDEIGDGIDFCLLDTLHVLPGELLDYLMVLPYLKPGCLLVCHDVRLHVELRQKVHVPKRSSKLATCILLSAVKGKKLLPAMTFDPGGQQVPPDFNDDFIPRTGAYPFINIAAVELSDDIQKNAWDVFNLLTLRWSYKIDQEEIESMAEHFSRFYEKKLVEFFRLASRYHQTLWDIEHQ